MQATLTLESDGKVALPKTLVERYGFKQNVPIRVIETEGGVLLVPLTDEPMDEALREELADWQAATLDAWAQFPYEEADAA
jgi:bifunctional DNA-binding transcriptional regulator/antitoxin component of YhaV-PrlF toxin-antitoxin module